MVARRSAPDPLDGMVKSIVVNASFLLLPLATFSVLLLIAFHVAEAWGGLNVAERLIPFANAHLLEEAVQGRYQPLLDPVFIGFTCIAALLAFGGTAAYVTKNRRNGARIALVSVLGAGIALVLWRYWIFASGYPWEMRWAFLAQVGMCVLFGVAAIAVGRQYSRPWHAV